MLIKKQITLIILIFSLVFASANITIYNQNKALINEYRKANLTYGIQTLVVPNIPNTVDPSSINLFSNEINFISKELLNNPITTKSILDALIGKNIELVKSRVYDRIEKASLSLAEYKNKLLHYVFSYRTHDFLKTTSWKVIFML